MKMGAYVIQTDFTVEECRRVVERIWETLLYSEYDDLKMSEYISESQENLLRMIKTTTGDDENYTLLRLYEDLIYCKRRLEI